LLNETIDALIRGYRPDTFIRGGMRGQLGSHDLPRIWAYPQIAPTVHTLGIYRAIYANASHGC